MTTQHVPLSQSAEGIVRGTGREGLGVTRTDETRKWNEGPSGEVEGMETLIAETLDKIKPTDPMKVIQLESGKKTKLIRFLTSDQYNEVPMKYQVVL